MQLIRRKPETAEEPISFGGGADERRRAFGAMIAAIARIKQPREGVIRALGADHFLDIPAEPPVPQKDLLGRVPPESKEHREWRQEVDKVGTEERQLRNLAEDAAIATDSLRAWMVSISEREEHLMTASRCKALTEADLVDIDAINRETDRFIRACESWSARLAY